MSENSELEYLLEALESRSPLGPYEPAYPADIRTAIELRKQDLAKADAALLYTNREKLYMDTPQNVPNTADNTPKGGGEAPMKCHCMEYYGSHHPECPIQQQVDAQTATYSSNVNALENIFSRLRDADSRYVLSVGLTREEIDAAEEPTFGGKGTRRYLTDIEYAAMCNLASAFDALLAERDAARAELAELKIQCAAKDSVIATYESDKFGLSRSPDGAQLGVWKKGFPDE